MLYWSHRLVMALRYTQLFVLICWGTPEQHQVFFPPLVSLSLSAVVTNDLLSATVRLCLKARLYITSAVNKVK